VIALLAAAALATVPAPQPQLQPQPQPLTIGEQYTFEAVEATRAVNIILPPDYAAEPDRRWPVVYLLDGAIKQDLMMGAGLMRWGALWGRSKDAIIVGIETKDRQRELFPPTAYAEERDTWPTAGESAVFRQWLAETVKPLVEARYRHDGTAFLVGESAAGHFVVETWADAPALFTGYAAISPSLQWNGEALSRHVTDEGDAARPQIYLSLADEGGATESGMTRLLASLSESQPFCFSDRRTELVHANSLHGLLPEALQYLLETDAGWLEEYGFTLRCERHGPLRGGSK